MPRGDRTGPLGQGPLTGRGLGPCGTGIGFRRGFGRGFAWGAFQPVIQPQVITETEEKEFLEDELKALKQEIEEIQKRLKELK